MAILVLMMLFIVAAIFAVFLFGIFTVVLGLIGGATTAATVKDKTVRKLLFLGFAIVSLVGLVCMLPILAIPLNMSGLTYIIATVVSCVGAAVLAVVGIRTANALQNKIAKYLLVVLFSLVLVAAVAVGIIVPVTGAFLSTPPG